jgi:hypothetical protein
MGLRERKEGIVMNNKIDELTIGMTQSAIRRQALKKSGGVRLKSTIALTLVSVALGVCRTAFPAVVAYDNADLPDYAPQPNHNWSAINGGFGYDRWTVLNDIILGTGFDGGTYMSGVDVEWRQVDDNWSFGLFAYLTGFDVSRRLVSPIALGQFTILTRFDVAGYGPNLINLRTGNDTTGFASGELLAFGIDGDFDMMQLCYRDATGTHVLPSGEARGAVWKWTINFNAVSGVYSLSVANLGGGFGKTLGGVLAGMHTTVGSFAVLNGSIGSYQNVIFDSPTFTVPPPK